MARLTSQKISEIQADLPAAAFSYASHYGITCVLKDAAAVTAGKEGTLYINTSGSSAMAKAGSGDVLTGILAGLMALEWRKRKQPLWAFIFMGWQESVQPEISFTACLHQRLLRQPGPLWIGRRRKSKQNETLQQSICNGKSGCRCF